jgi:hypothetical protein
MNCALNPKVNISGLGICLQALLTFGLKTDHSTSLPLDIIVTNLVVQLAALYLIISIYLDDTIDIPHSVIASYFIFMLSASRNNSFDFPAKFLQSIKGRLWATDMVFRPIMLASNFSVLLICRHVQTGQLCPARIMAARFPSNWKRICWWALRVSFCYSAVLCLLILISVEKTVSANNFGTMDRAWGFGQIFVMLDTLTLFIFVRRGPHLRGNSLGSIFEVCQN